MHKLVHYKRKLRSDSKAFQLLNANKDPAAEVATSGASIQSAAAVSNPAVTATVAVSNKVNNELTGVIKGRPSNKRSGVSLTGGQKKKPTMDEEK